jgi:UDP-N-acetyl-D-mannosaminuronic acid dehydrogenase
LVCVHGMGYVGLTLAVVMADVGFNVLGIEIRQDILDRLARGEPHFHEPGLAEKLRRVIHEGRLTVARRLPKDASANTHIITVGTPLDGAGRARLDMVEMVVSEVADRLQGGELIVMRSTVKLGTTRNVVKPILDRAGFQYDLAFCPERTLEGRALQELRRLPQIVGGLTLEATVRAAQIFQFLTPTTVRVSDPETAEMIKMIDNSSRDVSFSLANEIARLCDASRISAAEVIGAGKLGYDRTNLPLPGPVGGPCLSKDSYILAESFENTGVSPEIILTARKLNERQPLETIQHLAEATKRLSGFPPDPKIALLGFAFKGRPETDDLRGSMAYPIVEAVRTWFPNATLEGFDALVNPDEIATFDVAPVESIEQAFDGSSAVVIMNNHPTFSRLNLTELVERLRRPAIIYDFWNNFQAGALRLPQGIGYMALGSVARMKIDGS